MPLVAVPSPDDNAPAGDDAQRALERLYATQWAPMVRLAHLLLGDTGTAEEVVQDALVALHRRWGGLSAPEQDAAYLRRSVVNGCRSIHRHRQVERRHVHVLAVRDEQPWSHPDRSAEHDRVMTALRGLPERQREVLVLRYWSDASEEEIARTLRIGRGSVKTHAHRGLAAVRAVLQEDLGA